MASKCQQTSNSELLKQAVPALFRRQRGLTALHGRPLPPASNGLSISRPLKNSMGFPEMPARSYTADAKFSSLAQGTYRRLRCQIYSISENQGVSRLSAEGTRNTIATPSSAPWIYKCRDHRSYVGLGDGKVLRSATTCPTSRDCGRASRSFRYNLARAGGASLRID